MYIYYGRKYVILINYITKPERIQGEVMIHGLPDAKNVAYLSMGAE
jgi:hypothetical protein